MAPWKLRVRSRGAAHAVSTSAARARLAAVTEPGDAVQPRARRAPPALAAALAGGAFPLVVLANDIVYGYEPGPDAIAYLTRARQFARLDLLDPRTNVMLAPGYSAFLAAVGWIAGFAPLLLVASQALLYLGAVELFVRTLAAQRILRPGREPLLARALLLGNPNLWFLAGTIGAELLVAVLLLAITALLLRWREEVGMRSGWLASAACGLLAVTRFEWSLLPLLAPVLVRGGRGRARRTAVLLLGPILALSANAWRNHEMFGRPWPFSFGAGTVTYGGNNPNLDGSWHDAATTPGYVLPRHRQALAELAALERRDLRAWAPRQDRFWRGLAAEAWRERPLAQLAVVPLKLGKLWAMPLHFDLYTSDRGFRRSLLLGELFRRDRWPWYAPWKHGLYLVLHWLLLGAVAIGAREVWRRRAVVPAAGHLVAWALAITAGVSLLYALPWYGLPRFHGPLMPLLSVFAAAALAQLPRRGAASTAS